MTDSPQLLATMFEQTDPATTPDPPCQSSAPRLDKLVAELFKRSEAAAVQSAAYFDHLLRLQTELVTMQEWVEHEKRKIVVIFEGRDAAGKGGVIKRITQRLNPRSCKVVALPQPDDRERGQWYFQRYVQHLPSAGEITIFDRSWYNRAGVERVMGFCSDAEYEEFFQTVPDFERMLVRSGINLIKYWFSITYEEQYLRLMQRATDPLRRWKLSEMDVEARERWDQYTAAKAVMFQRSNIAEAPWWIVDAVDKRRARLNCIRHLLSLVPYATVDRRVPRLPAPLMGVSHTRIASLSAQNVPAVY